MKYINALFFLLLLMCCGQVVAQDGTNGVELKNLEQLNSEFEDNNPMPFGNKLMYAKARRKDKIFGPQLFNGSEKFFDLMTATKDSEGNWQEGAALGSEANFKFSDGGATFADAGSYMIYHRNDTDGENKKDTITVDLYEASVSGNVIKAEKKLPFNLDLYNDMHPALSKDGQTLYFSSDRPGGYGGMDLWMSKKTDTGWGNPINLGAEVNTPNNEVYPYADMNENIFYSSDRSGNLDILVAQMQDETWTYFDALGAPFNSASDDFNYVANAKGTAGYLASNRAGGKGLDDLYSWNYEPAPLEAVIVVIDEETEERLEAATVEITPDGEVSVLDRLYHNMTVGEPETLQTDANGSLNKVVYPKLRYNIKASKEDYFPKEVDVTTLELTENGEYIIPLKPKVIKQPLNGLVVNADTNEPIAGAKVNVTNVTTGETMEFLTGPDGKFSFEIDCSHEFKITAEKEPFSGDMVDLSGLLEQCKIGPVSTTLRLNPLRLVHVYFDFDKAKLRLDESLEDLNNLKRIMQENPNFTAELRGHTDSRGGTGYNKNLSMRRAKAVVDWLDENGVSKDRLVPVGLGETQLVNNCSNGVNCSELEHQLNRRTEFKLISKTIEIKEIKSGGKAQPRVDPCIGCPHQP